MKPSPDEVEICGRWEFANGRAIKDAACQRIELLTAQYLKSVGTDKSGWDVLYRDPTDSRYWELTYPQSQMHGGGPPRLAVLGFAEALKKYPVIR